MKVTKLLAFVMAFAMVISLVPVAGAAKTFEKTNNWENGDFSDVPGNEWFASNVKDAFELGLMKGAGNKKFNPHGNISLAETITIAARIHSLATTGEEKFEQGNPWYQVYADYALENGIVSSIPANITSNATRLQFAEILAKAMSDEDLSAINTVDDGIIPDVAKNDAVYKLYRAGVLTGGDDKGTFSPANSISRAEVSAIVARMALPETRIKRDLKKTVVSNTEDKKTPNVGTMGGGGSSSVVKPQKPQDPPKSEISATVEVDDEGKVKNEVSMSGEKVNATVPAGVAVNEGAEKLTLKVEEMEETGGNIELGEDETLSSYDVHIDGISSENTVAVKVFLGDILPVGMNLGNITLYHVENEETNAMTQVATLDELDAHNEFYYDPATGNVTVALASFSEIAIVAEEPKWEGNYDFGWYNTNATELTIANADQLAGLSAIVGGMLQKTPDSFKGKTIKMICDINIGDLDSENGIVFYPVGYYNTEGTYTKDPNATTGVTSGFKTFEGTFDGNGHTISNFVQNTWEMKGDHDWYDANLQYYRDGMGVFGKVYGGTVKNLTVDNFSSDGEIATTGVIAAYADGATFENIAIFNCNPRVYNIGNGGIVGCVGWYAKEAGLKTTFKNITVDNSNKISALWGSYDVPCGGIVGQYYPTSGQTSAGTPKNGGIDLVNCHVTAQMDVYNDVCANYQYYAYRYAGILIGSVRENVEQNGHVYPNMDGITATGCTVRFGDWNDYYYCELVANSLASYTHDHQMSRLEQVESVDVANKSIVTLKGETKAIPTSGAANYVVVKAKYDDGKWKHGDGHDFAECYHFVNGEVWNHADAGTETVGGVEVLKEDKQCIYREFNNLVTGYGWGVTTKGVGDMAGVTILDRTDAGSAEKFKGKGISQIETNTVYKLSELFEYIGIDDDLKLAGLNVTVGDLDETDGIATGEFDKASNWENSTITVRGEGKITITIQDYYFCVPTTISLDVINTMELIVDATTLYQAGQKLDIKSVTVKYKSGEIKVLTADEYEIGEYDFSFAGNKTITIYYKENGKTISATLKAEVTDEFNGLIASPKKTTYDVGYTFDADDFNVTAVDSNGRKSAISGYEISKVDTNVRGNKTVTVSVKNPNTGKVTSTTCEVTIFNLKNISDKVEQYWFFDGNFNVSGWSNWIHGDVYNYTYYATTGSDYLAPNGETVTGFDISWADPATTPNNGATGTGQTAHMSKGRYDLVIDNALPYTTLGINCIAGYSEPLLGFGYYVDDDLSTLQFNAPAIVYDETNCGAPNESGYTMLDYLGPNNGHSLLEMNCNKFAPGSSHTVHWVAVFEGGVKNISEWTVNMKAAEQSDAAFVDTEKPNVNVIIMAGQSNMFGASPITQMIRDKYQNHKFSNVYIKYNNINFDVNADGTMPGTMQTVFSNDGFQTYQLGIGGQSNSYFGPEAAVAHILSTEDQFKNEQWYIIKYAAAGTILQTQWMGTCMVNGQTTTLTNDMLAYVQEAITGLENDGFDVKIHSFMWMQGESDAIDKSVAENYATNEKLFVGLVRNALAGNATRYAGDPSVPGGGMAFISAGIAMNNTDSNTANGGPNDWIWAEIVNSGKISNSQQLCSVPGYDAAVQDKNLETGPLAGKMFKVDTGDGNKVPTPTIVNPNLKDTIVNSIFLDTHYLSSKLNSTNEHIEYTGGDATDWAHYGAASMDILGELFASGHHFMMVTGPVATSKHTVTFDANGGDVDSDSATGNTVTLPTPTREGYTFNGWYTAATGGDKIGDAGASYTPEKDITLYAQWTERKKYTVTYNANGGSESPSSVTVYEGDSVTLPTLTRNRYTFKGWYTSTSSWNSTKIGDAGASYTPEKDITLYAQWTYNW